MAGYHVHEKAILMVCVPLALDAVQSIADARAFLSVSVTGHFALLPLLFTRDEYPIKVGRRVVAAAHTSKCVLDCMAE
jgi:alpha-1,3-glucosyltransferase